MEEVKKEKVNGLQIRLAQTYGSQSEADCGFCTLLAYKHGNDPDAIDEEFREVDLTGNTNGSVTTTAKIRYRKALSRP